MSRYADLRAVLIGIQSKFDSYSRSRLAPLKHDLIPRPDTLDWTEEAFSSFKAANVHVGGVPWESWELWPDGLYCGRFWGQPYSERWLQEFKELASRTYLVLHEFGGLVQAYEPVPQGFEAKMPKTGDVDRLGFVDAEFVWLELLYRWGEHFPTTRLQVSKHDWNHSGPVPKGAAYFAFIDQMTTPADGGAPYHPHPFFWSLDVDVFEASAELIQLFTAPEDVVPVTPPDYEEPEIFLPEEADTPSWDGERLWFRDALIKEFIKPAEDQRAVLHAFESNGWPEWVENPFLDLFPSDLDKAISKLENAVKGLNDDHITEQLIRFGTRKEKEYAYWTPVSE